MQSNQDPDHLDVTKEMDEEDPSLQDGFHVIYDREVMLSRIS